MTIATPKRALTSNLPIVILSAAKNLMSARSAHHNWSSHPHQDIDSVVWQGFSQPLSASTIAYFRCPVAVLPKV